MVAPKVCCFGEILLRLSPELNGTWIRQAKMPVHIGGAELNVARALALWQLPVKFASALPRHYLAEEMVRFLEQQSIDVSAIHWSGQRVGTYYLPQGADLKHAGVIYDRAGSSFAGLEPGRLNWDAILKDITWFHFSAISPAVSASAAEVCLEALEACQKRNIRVSVDLNYRSRLWQFGKKPSEIMRQLLPYCHLVMGNIWSADELLGIPVDKGIHEYGSEQAYLDHARQTALAIMRAYPQCEAVANTFRFDKGDALHYFASYDLADKQVTSRSWQVQSVIDRVGSGDCFMAGLLWSYLNRKNPEQLINFAAAAAMLKLQERGDATQQSVSAIEQQMELKWPQPKI